MNPNSGFQPRSLSSRPPPPKLESAGQGPTWPLARWIRPSAETPTPFAELVFHSIRSAPISWDSYRLLVRKPSGGVRVVTGFVLSKLTFFLSMERLTSDKERLRRRIK